MSGRGISPRLPLAIGFAALVPVAVYGMTNSMSAALVSAVNVVLLIGALVLAMQPVPNAGPSHG